MAVMPKAIKGDDLTPARMRAQFEIGEIGDFLLEDGEQFRIAGKSLHGVRTCPSGHVGAFGGGEDDLFQPGRVLPRFRPKV